VFERRCALRCDAFRAKAVEVAISDTMMIAISVRTSVLTSSAGFSLAIRRDKIDN
jgi:hypothetical protein